MLHAHLDQDDDNAVVGVTFLVLSGDHVAFETVPVDEEFTDVEVSWTNCPRLADARSVAVHAYFHVQSPPQHQQ